jgi:autotransporter adhesin
VNGAQLYATNQQVQANTDAINNLTTMVTGGGNSPAQYSDAGTPTTPNGGTVTDDATLVGSSGPVQLHNVADGSAPTDAVNVGQLQTVADAVATLETNTVQYDDASQASVTLAGTSGTTIANVADGTLSTTSTEAVNGSQLHATNQQVASNTQNIANNRTDIDTNTADITNIRNTLTGSTVVPVQYSDAATPTQPNGGTVTNDVTLIGRDNNAPVALHNVAAGTSATDAVNLGQMQAGLDQTLTRANDYTDQRFAAINADLSDFRRDASAGTAGALAAAALPQAMDPGASMLSISVGQFRSEMAWAMGFSTTFNEGRGVIRAGAMVDSQGHAGTNVGAGIQF